ncbi:MAG: hypothetical protein HQL08_14265 [Nitrospirae bacterium]|nr:hypothetical protein [Nitrospirota bacterium]
MARTKPTVKEIVDLIESMGGRRITEEDKKTDWYKFAFKEPSCFKRKMIHKETQRKLETKKPSLLKTQTIQKKPV